MQVEAFSFRVGYWFVSLCHNILHLFLRLLFVAHANNGVSR